jgi:nicotinic acid mononucleotide adenylyltransferase
MTTSNILANSAILVLPGSFNPIHRQHMRILEIARTYLRAEGWSVRSAFLSPSSDDYVKGKGAALSLSFRIELCELAAEELPWVDVWTSGEPSSYRAAKEIVQSLVNSNGDDFPAACPKAIEVMGSDTAERILRRVIKEWRLEGGSEPWYVDRLICCVLRPGEDPAAWFSRLQNDFSEWLIRIGVRVLVANPIALGLDLRDVSSTLVRRLIDQGDWETLASNQYLDQRVFDVLHRRK